jgi:transposase
MANVLKMTVIQTIHSLRSTGLSFREISRRLGIHRETVARYARMGSESVSKPSKVLISPAGSEERVDGFEVLTGSAGSNGSRNAAAPWLAWILDQRARGLTAKRIHQDLLVEFSGAAKVSYESVRRLLKKHGGSPSVPFRRMEVPPGYEAQVDFGMGAPVVGSDGKRRRTHVLRVVLSHSRKGYSEAVFTQSTDDFIGCLENAFEHFGGVPHTLVVDNLKAAVIKADWFDPELNPKLAEFCRHYGTIVLPTKPRTPRHKGKVERGVAYVQDNALKGRKFTSLSEQNEFLLNWEQKTADLRIHGTTKRQVLAVFHELEKQELLPLSSGRFQSFKEARRKVGRDGHVEVARAYYSVPPEYLGREVWARWDSRTVRVFNDQHQQIAVHARHEHGRFSTAIDHVHEAKINGLEKGIAYLLGKTRSIGPKTHAWAEAVVAVRGIQGHRVVQGLLALTRKHTCESLEKACETALSNQCYHLRSLRQLIGHQADRQEPLEFLSEHEMIRPLEDYASVVAQAIHRQERSRPSMGEGFESYDAGMTVACKDHRPASGNSQGDGGMQACLRSGYRSPGCSSAEPDSSSPNSATVPPDSVA